MKGNHRTHNNSIGASASKTQPVTRPGSQCGGEPLHQSQSLPQKDGHYNNNLANNASLDFGRAVNNESMLSNDGARRRDH